MHYFWIKVHYYYYFLLQCIHELSALLALKEVMIGTEVWLDFSDGFNVWEEKLSRFINLI